MLDQLVVDSQDWIILLARVLLAALFIMTGWQKMTGFSGTVSYMRTVHAPAPVVSAGVAAVVEFFGGLAVLLGVLTRSASLILAAFTLASGVIGHHYWTQDGELRYQNQLNFFKNLSIAGGFFLLAVCGPGRFSIWP